MVTTAHSILQLDLPFSALLTHYRPQFLWRGCTPSPQEAPISASLGCCKGGYLFVYFVVRVFEHDGHIPAKAHPLREGLMNCEQGVQQTTLGT